MKTLWRVTARSVSRPQDGGGLGWGLTVQLLGACPSRASPLPFRFRWEDSLASDGSILLPPPRWGRVGVGVDRSATRRLPSTSANAAIEFRGHSRVPGTELRGPYTYLLGLSRPWLGETWENTPPRSGNASSTTVFPAVALVRARRVPHDQAADEASQSPRPDPSIEEHPQIRTARGGASPMFQSSGHCDRIGPRGQTRIVPEPL
jgi:hypothetical protein